MTQRWVGTLEDIRKQRGKPEAWSNRNGMKHQRHSRSSWGSRRKQGVTVVNARLFLPKSVFIYSQQVTKGHILNTQLNFTMGRWRLSKKVRACARYTEAVIPRNMVFHICVLAVASVLKAMDKRRPSTLWEVVWRDHPKLPTSASTGLGAGQTSQQLFNTFLKKQWWFKGELCRVRSVVALDDPEGLSQPGWFRFCPTVSLAKLRWSLANLTDGKVTVIFYPHL